MADLVGQTNEPEKEIPSEYSRTRFMRKKEVSEKKPVSVKSATRFFRKKSNFPHDNAKFREDKGELKPKMNF